MNLLMENGWTDGIIYGKIEIYEYIYSIFQKLAREKRGKRVYPFVPGTDGVHPTGRVLAVVGKWHSWLCSRKSDGRGVPIHLPPRRLVGMAAVAVERLRGA